MFKQDLKSFLSSKTNWTGVTMVITGIIGPQYGMDPMVAYGSIMNGLGFVFVKDAVS